MDPSAWIALAGFAFVVIVQFGASMWWCATLNEKVRALQERDKDHSDVRDLVIELKADMKNFTATVAQLGDAIRDISRPVSRQRKVT